LESGKVVANLRIAVNRRAKDSPPDWVGLVAWDKTAEIIAEYVHKGDLIGVDATLKIETWTDRQTGEEKSKAVFQIEELTLLGKAGKRNNDSSDYDNYDDDF
jgi:single-strand DNA-binding protein